MLNRLQFLHNDRVFRTKEDAISHLKYYRDSLYGEPIVMKYQGEDAENPSLLLVIGAEGEEGNTKKNFFVIDHNQVVTDIEKINDDIAKAIASLSLKTVPTNTLELSAENKENGTELTGNVKVSKGKIDGTASRLKRNALTVEPDGLFIFVDMYYDEETNKLVFTVNDTDMDIQLPEEDYIESCEYDAKTESLVIRRKKGEIITCSLSPVINEWTVEGERTTTPVILTKERVIYDPDTASFRDVLRGDIRIADNVDHNILKKDRTGSTLYVKGTADNIMYDNNTTVKAVIDANKLKVSYDDANMIYQKEDGLFATVSLSYDPTINTLTFTRSAENGGVETKSIALRGVKFFDDIHYHPSTKILEIQYTDNTGELQTISIDMTDLLNSIDWVAQNDGHNVRISKIRTEGSSNAQVSADVKISSLEDNILVDKDHTLYVQGVSSNIKHNETTVSEVLNTLTSDVATNKAKIASLENGATQTSVQLENLLVELNAEIARATEADETLSETQAEHTTSIQSLLADNEIQQVEIANLTEALGEGFDVRNTVADAVSALTQDIEAEEARATAKETEIENALNATKAELEAEIETSNIQVLDTATVELVDTTTNGHQLTANVKISEEDNNLIKANADGIYAKASLTYDNANNELHFTTSDGTDNVIHLLTQSLADDIHYDPMTECIVFTWIKDGVSKQIMVNVRQLIDEWETRDTDTVTLTRQYNFATEGENIATKDILTADVKICPTDKHADNILVSDNGLYVSGAQIETNKNDIISLSLRVAELEEHSGDTPTIVVDDKISSASTNPVQNKVIFEVIKENELVTSEAINKIQESCGLDENLVYHGISSTTSIADAIELLANNIGTTITVDDGLSETSTNPVQNKVITAELEDLNERVLELEDRPEIIIDDEISSASTNPVQNKVIYDIIINNERVLAESLNQIKNSCGFDEHLVYEGISSTTSIADAIELLANNTSGGGGLTPEERAKLNQIDNKVDKVDGKGLIDTDVADVLRIIDGGEGLEINAEVAVNNLFATNDVVDGANNKLSNKVDKVDGKGLIDTDVADAFGEDVDYGYQFDDGLRINGQVEVQDSAHNTYDVGDSLSAINVSLETKIDDAPQDGKTYGRKDGTWVENEGGGLTPEQQELLNEMELEVFPLTVSYVDGRHNDGKYEIGTDVIPTADMVITQHGKDVASASTVSANYTINLTEGNTAWHGESFSSGTKSYAVKATYKGKTANFPTLTFTCTNYRYFAVLDEDLENTEAVVKAKITSLPKTARELSTTTTLGATELPAGKYYLFAVIGTPNLVCRDKATEAIVDGYKTGTIEALPQVNHPSMTNKYSYIIVPASKNAWSFKITNS